MQHAVALFINYACPTSFSVQGEQNPKLIERIANFDVGSISVMTLAQLTRLLAEPEFNIVQVCLLFFYDYFFVLTTPP